MNNKQIMLANKNPRDKLRELQGIVTKMPLTVCCSMALPEFGLKWKQVSRAVRNCRLPMQSSSVAQVLCEYLAKSMPQDELDDILARLRLKSVAIQERTWHVLHLHEPTDQEPISELLHILPHRVLTALQSCKKGTMKPEVQSLLVGELLYLSVRFASQARDGATLYLATPPGHPVAYFSTLPGEKLLQACVEGLGFASFTRASLQGSHIPSLHRVASGAWHAAAPAPYAPAPAPTLNGIDYTHAHYDKQYVDKLIGPNPPLLTELNIKTTCDFFDRARLNKTINLSLHLKSENIATTLKTWVTKGAIAADSGFIKLIQETRSNKITYTKEVSESE